METLLKIEVEIFAKLSHLRNIGGIVLPVSDTCKQEPILQGFKS